MKRDLKLWVAILILIALVIYLISLSINSNKAITQQGLNNRQQIEVLKEDVSYLEGHPPAAGKTPVKGVDYFDGKDGTSCSIQALPGGAVIACSDGKVAAISNGTTGMNGTNGTNGKDGSVGSSAYQNWLNLGNIGTEQDFINSLKGDKGDTGAPGKQQLIQCNNGIEQTKYEGNTFWINTNIKCETTND